jgi:phospholipid N-methyltransferase
MMNGLDLQHAKVVVELGAGTGAITTELLDRVSHGTRVVIIESNSDSIALLKKRLPASQDIAVVLGDAEKLDQILGRLNIASVDAIVSSLPYASLGPSKTNSILAAATAVLSPHGHFVAFQYTPLLRKKLEKYFDIITSEVELRNFPPAVVYLCHPKRRHEQRLDLEKSA